MAGGWCLIFPVGGPNLGSLKAGARDRGYYINQTQNHLAAPVARQRVVRG